jgi:eukaryotic-like serine/threonine-protein kinase
LSACTDIPFPDAMRGPYQIPSFFDFLEVLVFGSVAAFLLVTGREDARAVSLSGFFLALASAFCARRLIFLTDREHGFVQTVAFALDSVKLDILLPFFLWRFVRDFPRTHVPHRVRQMFRLALRFCILASSFLLAVNFVRTVWHARWGKDTVPALLLLLAPKTGTGLYHTFLLTPAALALPFLVWKARSAVGDERRRVGILTAGVVAGLLPSVVEPLAEVCFNSSYFAYMSTHPKISTPMAEALALLRQSVPFTVAYAVLVHRALDVRLIARKAVQYALARYSVMVLAAVPFLTLCAYLFENRKKSLATLFSGDQALLLVSATLLGVAALRYRDVLLEAVDRRFFREQYDARQILTHLVERIRATNEAVGLANLIACKIEDALHLEGTALLVLDARSGVLSDPRRRALRLDAFSSLALKISNGHDPLDVDLENPRSTLFHLPEKERHWLVDNGFRLLVPILARDGSLLGVIGLGEKKSGLPFLKEDRQLLQAVAYDCGWVLELDRSRVQPRPSLHVPEDDDLQLPDLHASAATELAKECPIPACGKLYPHYTVFCTDCSHRLEEAHVPYVLPGRLRFERRIGSGGMGVVYRAVDLTLNRPVAVKTLRRVSPEDAMRLRREARTAAMVSHPHLAAAYFVETWQGTPMLVLELLEGGTLAQRIKKGKLGALETVELGIAMAEALAQLHVADILHRDIKPSNIGYTKDGVPKLMDFGIARLMFEINRESDATSTGSLGEETSIQLPPNSIWNQTPTAITFSKQLVGTLPYLSPEALNSQPPDASFDLWGLAIVLYECLLGRKVFPDGEVRQTMARIRMGRVPDFAQICPEYDESLAEFFRSALHKTLGRRPATAHDLKQRLEAVRLRLAA